ncbi:hypothetical protein BH11PSE3_BH11PSE3_24050 [soil metagenome]
MNTGIRQLVALATGRTPLHRRLLALGVAFIVVTGVLVGLIVQLRVDAIAAGEKVLTAFVQLTEQQTTLTVKNAEQTLEIVNAKLDAAILEGAAGDDNLPDELGVLLKSRPFLKAITVLDVRGRVLYNTNGLPTEVDLSERQYFKSQRDLAGTNFLLSAPILSRATGGWVIPASRSWRLADGQFAGVIVVSLDPLFFNRIWTVDKSIQNQATALWRDDGVVFMRSPFEAKVMGVAFSQGVLAQRIAHGSREGTFRTVSIIDGQDRLVAYRGLSAYPEFTLSVTQLTNAVLSTWWHTTLIVVAGWLIVAATLIWLAVELMKESSTRVATQDRYRVLFQANPYPMAVVDRTTLRFLAINDAALDEYGYSLEEAATMTPNDLYAAEDLAAGTAAQASDTAYGTKIVRGLRHRKKDGTIFDVDMHTRAIVLDGKRAVLAITEDVTARRAVEEQLRQSQKMEAVGQLTGGIAHDFNNILMVILGNIDALQEEESLDPGLVDRFDQIGQAVDRASDLTRQLLAFSRKQPLRPQPTDVNELVSATGKMLRRALGGEIEIDSILAEDIGVVNIDRSQLEAALVNLCINARDAMPEGGRLLIETSDVTLDEEYVALNPECTAGHYAMLAVTDAGRGIPPEQLGKVFEPFFTTKGVGKGTGLGLSMVHGFVGQSKGHIKIYSEVGRGTTVRLYLPCSGGEAEGPALDVKGPLPRGIERILVVEDEPRVRASVVQQLRSLGYAVSEAQDGASGVAAFEAEARPWDLLLTDVVMPGPLSGKALADEVTRRWPATRIVFMSGYTETAIVHNGRLDAGVLLLSKPFRKGDLAQMVRQALDGVPVHVTGAG